jgi:hypothetical protein
MGYRANRAEFVSPVAREMAIGIDRALRYWLGRIEIEVVDRSLSSEERIYAIEQILQEYKDVAESTQVGCAPA